MELLCRLADTRLRLGAMVGEVSWRRRMGDISWRRRMGDISWVLRRKIRRRLSLMSLRSEEECEGVEEDPGQDDKEETGELEHEDSPETVICWATATADHIPSPYDR